MSEEPNEADAEVRMKRCRFPFGIICDNSFQYISTSSRLNEERNPIEKPSVTQSWKRMDSEFCRSRTD
jgi:hypothetical protein